MKVCFLGAGSTVFCKNVLGDVLLTPALNENLTIALYDIDSERLEESYIVIQKINDKYNGGKAKIEKYLGVENRKSAFKNADFIVNAIQVGGYEPSTVIDFEIPKKYGLKQTIGDTLGVGGIMRGLRTIKVLKEIANDIEEVSPNALFLNYTNPMAILTGYMQRYTKVKTIGLCHSVQVCSKSLFESINLNEKVGKELIAGINHMAWLLKIENEQGKDLYPEIKQLAKKANEQKHGNMVRLDYIDKLGYYCTESSEHNAEYNPFYIKNKYPELIEEFCIPIDEYPRRCVNQIKDWKAQREKLVNGNDIEHTRSIEYASYIMEAVVTNKPYRIGGNVINNGYISNLPSDACVEVPCVVDSRGITPDCKITLPVQLAAMNMTNINAQLLTIEAAATGKKEHIYHALMLDPHTSSELSIKDIINMADELIEEHAKAGFPVI